MKMIVGIGNPGREYADTRHNVGFMVVDRLAAVHSVRGWRDRFQARTAEANLAGARVLLMKPMTYMNESGVAVRAAAQWRDTPCDDVMVVCDDFNLPLGRLRVRGGGSSGGHNGLASIAAHLGSDAFPRMRIGIGETEPGGARDFVLSGFLPEERPVVVETIDRAVSALETWLEAGLEECQNRFNASPESNKSSQRRQNEEADA